MPPAPRPSQVPADPLARLGMTAEELDERYAHEIALCRKFGGIAAELAEHEATAERE